MTRLRACQCLEEGLVVLHYGRADQAETCFQSAANATGLEMELTGVAGRRLVHQAFDASLLILKAHNSNDVEQSMPPYEPVLTTVLLNDPNLMEHPRFSEELPVFFVLLY